MNLDRFYPVFDDIGWLERLLPLGLRLVQLRMKDRDESTLRRQIRQARTLCQSHGCQLVVNDYWRLAIDEGCDCIHLGQEDLDDADIDALREAGVKLGISTHDRSELERALALSPAYIALGPIYPTRLKQMKWHAQGLERLGAWKRRIGDIPLVAIGGMSVDRAAGAFAAGADSVAAVTDITLHPDPAARIAQWLSATRPAA
ncbi:thiamine phosphate synthase [Paludibacterium yongneupense]|uniref:thiamine phosphate synthase n=1 Tax=Paludibacterium yongneupense TaxID=400061 RepID=UPI00041CC248|nr:thiamine phosphate synthase [Paludibacterium yongneupense]